MNENSLQCYFTPEIEVNEIQVEKGFTISNMEPIESEKESVKW